MAGSLDRIPLVGGEQPPPFGPVEHGWGMARRDAANTATNPEANGPTDDPDIIWEYDIGENHPGADSMLSVLAEP